MGKATVFLFAYVCWSALCLVRNALIARASGLPVRLSPITPSNPFWILFGKRLSRVLLYLPFGLGAWTKFTTIDWHWVDRADGNCEVHQANGDTFMHVTPGGINLHTRDPQVADQVLRKLPKIRDVARMLEVCGPNLVSADEESWPRHRKITVSTLSDRNNRLVWAETVRQTRQMVNHYVQSSDGFMFNIPDDTRKLYLHVLSAVCFGMQYDFTRPSEDYIPPGHERTYRYCLDTSLKDIFYLHIVPRWAFKLPGKILPRKIREFHEACREMFQYLDEMIQSCKKDIRENGVNPQANNLLRMTVQNNRAFKAERRNGNSAPDERMYLTDDEVRGNLFIYSLGGHESNAHTLLYALYLLAAHPDVQEWLFEELESTFARNEHDLGSEDTFLEALPNMPRTIAVMYEVLRLYPSIIFLPKTVGPTAATIKIGDREMTIPGGTNVWVNMCGMQVNESTWGPDAKAFVPSRWVKSSPNGGDRFEQPAAGSFVAWSGGKQVCPGVKFSQAAFAAALAVLFHKHRLEIVTHNGESYQEASRRTLAVVSDSYVGTTILMRQPEAVELKLVAR